MNTSQILSKKPKQKLRRRFFWLALGLALAVTFTLIGITIWLFKTQGPDQLATRLSIIASITASISTPLILFFTITKLPDNKDDQILSLPAQRPFVVQVITSPSSTSSEPPAVKPHVNGRIWNVPFPRNPLFTGRENILKELHDALVKNRIAALTQPQAISGLGGIGKTQTAVEYAYRYAEKYQAVLWVGADTPEIFATSLAALARTECLNLPVKDEQDRSVIIAGVLQWLQTHTDWLLILDNSELDQPHTAELLRQILTLHDKGDLLLTTRSRATGNYIQRVSIDILSEGEGALFLLRRIKCLNSYTLSEASASDFESARAITQALGGLPLALDQAGAYIEERQCSMEHYLQLYLNEKERIELLRQRGRTALDHPESVMVTFALSFNEIQQFSPLASDILRVCAFLYAEEIPEAILVKGASELGPNLHTLDGQPQAFDDAMAILSRYSLVKRDTEHRMLSLHRVVQAVLQSVMREKEQRQWGERVIEAISKTFPKIDHTMWAQCEKYVPHARVCVRYIDRWHIETKTAVLLLNQIASYLDDRTQYEEALQLYQQALIINERVLGPEHPDTARSLNNLALPYKSQGRDEKALPLLERALVINEQMLGPAHPDTARSLNNLALLYDGQGKGDKAFSLLKRALAINERMLGPEHPYTARCLNNLALIYRSRGKDEEALPLLERALAINEQTLGPEHPDTARYLSNLALLKSEQGKEEEALPLLKRALNIREKVLGPHHPDVANSLNNLAALYGNQGKEEEALSLYQRALAIRIRVLGQEHPDTAITLNNLATLYKNQGKEEEAL